MVLQSEYVHTNLMFIRYLDLTQSNSNTDLFKIWLSSCSIISIEIALVYSARVPNAVLGDTYLFWLF